MAFTKAELMRVPGTDKPEFHAWRGHTGLYLRVKLDPSMPEAPYRGVSRIWYWRGTLNHAARTGHANSEPIWIALGNAHQTSLTDDWLADEAFRLKRQCKLGVDPRIVEEEPIPAQGVDTLDEGWAKFLASEKGQISDNYLDDIRRKWAWSVSRLEVEIGKGAKREPIMQVLGTIKMDALRITYFDDFFRILADRPIASNRMLRILNEFMDWAKDRYPEMPTNLVSSRKYYQEDPDEDRLWEDEIVRFGKALSECAYKHKWNILFLLLTGCRSGVLTHWDPSWIKGDYLEIPRATPYLKNPRSAIYVLLPPMVKGLVDRVGDCTQSGLEKCVTNLCRKAKIVRDKVTILSPHDLRSSHISEGCDSGQLEEVMLALTQHKSRSKIGRIYNQRDILRLMPVADQVSRHLVELMGLDPAIYR